MKKFISILLVTMLFVTCLATTGFAAEQATVSVDSMEAQPGDIVTLTYSVSKAQFANYELKVTFDSPLKLTAINNAGKFAGSLQANLDESSSKFGKVTFANGENLAGDNALFTATFEVPTDIEPGTYEVTATVYFFSDRDLDDLTVSVCAGSITIPEPEPQPTEPQPTEPQPTEPQPTEPQPTEPLPTEPQPTEPQPTEPQPTEPGPNDGGDDEYDPVPKTGDITPFIFLGTFAMISMAGVSTFAIKRKFHK